MQKEQLVKELETKYKTKELESEKIRAIKEAEWNKKLFLGALVIGLMLLILAALVIYQIQQRRKVEKVKLELRETQQRLDYERQVNQSELAAIKAQMNPHFLFNAFNSIQEFILLNEKENASNYLGQFADLMRTFLNHSRQKSVGLTEEIEAEKLYLELEKLRFGDSFDYAIEVDKELNSQEIEIPPMLIQPFIENAIKHGLLHKKENRKLWLTFKAEGDSLICCIKDNGIGRAESAKINHARSKKHKSFATSAIENRVQLINQYRKKPISINTIDLRDGEKSMGTEVIIKIPFE